MVESRVGTAQNMHSLKEDARLDRTKSIQSVTVKLPDNLIYCDKYSGHLAGFYGEAGSKIVARLKSISMPNP